jgi:hypothetical protein
METLTIHSPKTFQLDGIVKSLAKDLLVEASPTETLIVRSENSRAYIHLDLTQKQTGPYGLLIDYSDIDLIKEIIVRIGNDPALIIDNDFGVVLPGDAFVGRIVRNKDWDWRKT